MGLNKKGDDKKYNAVFSKEDFNRRKESYIILLIFCVATFFIVVVCLFCKIHDRVGKGRRKVMAIPNYNVDQTNQNIVVSQELTLMNSDLHQPSKTVNDLEKGTMVDHHKHE